LHLLLHRFYISLASRRPSMFFFYCSGDPRDLHSFPTRRSSDLDAVRVAGARRIGHGVALPDEAEADETAEDMARRGVLIEVQMLDRKSTRLNSSHVKISYAVFCLKKKKKKEIDNNEHK